MKHRSTYADTQGHAETPKEGVHGRRGSLVAPQAHGLGRRVESVEQQAVSETQNHEADHPHRRARSGVPRDGQARADTDQRPSRPDGPAVRARAGDDATDDDGGRDECKHDGEDRHACPQGRLGSDGLEEEGDVIQLAIKLGWDQINLAMVFGVGGCTENTRVVKDRKLTSSPWTNAPA